ncbi:MAG: excinuclease ABC subunit UvrA [Bacteroidetes bacterium]|nr:excinuclease ABC subunit UvrA [Bacteroidota bacterium]
MPTNPPSIEIINATENNLCSVSLAFPKNQLIVVTGVSGSGKSSLVFDVLYKEAGNRFLGSLSFHARQFLGKLKRPDVERIEGLSPAISVDRKSVQRNPRSTVGTLSEIYDFLRLLFARTGSAENPHPGFAIDRSLFSFNSPSGACPHCKGLGVEDRLDPEMLIANPEKSIRDGAFVITAPNGYIIYSQVTLDVLDQVCRSEGFTIDIPWKEMTPEQQNIILYGSNKLEIPFGKHTLESRMRWTGITAKPRELGYYKGIIPVMETILKRERNKNILRFVRTTLCSVCNGARLNPDALSVRVNGWNIAELSAMQMNMLQEVLSGMAFSGQGQGKEISSPIIEQISKRIGMIQKLGLGYLSPDRESTTLSEGEAQRLRLALQAGTGLTGLLYLFDEPSIGLHSHDSEKLLGVLEDLRDQGNTVIVVEHEEDIIRRADWLIDMGPGAGINGGRVLQNLSASAIAGLPMEEIRKSRTLSFLSGLEKIPIPSNRRPGKGILKINGAKEHNLKNIDVEFRLESLNVVTGVSGAGKSTLTLDILGKYLRHILHGANEPPGLFSSIEGFEKISKVISIDQSPIGRTPRSNPATYTGLFDFIRDIFAGQPLSKEMGLGKTHFSFNTPGGRCEECQGAGYIEIGMHFMGDVEILCEECEGKRFKKEPLEVFYKGKNVAEILEMPISEAVDFFADQPRVFAILKVLNDLGVGYLKLGQRSSTLSGGEAQRIKLASELARPQAPHTLYILDEPTTGLHQADVSRLLHAFEGLINKHHTVIVVEHHLGLIAAADHIIDLGPESGDHGGYLVVTGTPEEILTCPESHTAKVLRDYLVRNSSPSPILFNNKEKGQGVEFFNPGISFKGVSTHNLQNVDIFIPYNKITVITGVSGSGKSSFAFDTLYAEANNRFLESFSTYIRTQAGINERPDFTEVTGLTPVLAVDQKLLTGNARSTVGTFTGILDLYRLLFSRIGISASGPTPVLSSLFSFNHQHGACNECKGLGYITVCDPDRLITYPDKSLFEGAMDGSKTGKFYGDPHGQYIATLKAAGIHSGIDFLKPWSALSDSEKEIAWSGTGNTEFEVSWEYQRDKLKGVHSFRGKWQGLAKLVQGEYERKHADHRGQGMMSLMKQITCPSCKGARINREALVYSISGKNISELSGLSVSDSLEFFRDLKSGLNALPARIASQIISSILKQLETIADIGLPYITLDRNSATLSAGEAQRLKLAGQISTGLTGLTYVLDEPTLGLHPKDTAQLIEKIRLLRDSGNTIVIVEHDRDVILSADHIIDMGPGAGKNGGKIIATGTPSEIMANPDSLTGKHLARKTVVHFSHNRTLKEGLYIQNAFVHNLKGFNLNIPAGGIILVTGVSGSGKSSLVNDLIYESWKNNKPVGCDRISGFNHFQQIVSVGQKSNFTGSAGITATFTGVFDRIRDIFAATDDAKRINLNRNYFSFHNREGRCDSCEGNGKIRISMDFLSDIWVVCEKCNGKRFNDPVLSCNYKGKSIADILDMTFSEALIFFHDHKILSGLFKMIEETGIGYLSLGQSLESLSGGEAQRLLLGSELLKPVRGNTLFLFDEPSTGLHFDDIHYLVEIFHRLADQGNTLLIIEHDPEICCHADWVIEFGPEGGRKGGYNIFSGKY